MQGYFERKSMGMDVRDGTVMCGNRSLLPLVTIWKLFPKSKQLINTTISNQAACMQRVISLDFDLSQNVIVRTKKPSKKDDFIIKFIQGLHLSE